MRLLPPCDQAQNHAPPQTNAAAGHLSTPDTINRILSYVGSFTSELCRKDANTAGTCALPTSPRRLCSSSLRAPVPVPPPSLPSAQQRSPRLGGGGIYSHHYAVHSSVPPDLGGGGGRYSHHYPVHSSVPPDPPTRLDGRADEVPVARLAAMRRTMRGCGRCGQAGTSPPCADDVPVAAPWWRCAGQ